MRASQTFSTLTRFVENACNIYILKWVYYESIFNDLPSDTLHAYEPFSLDLDKVKPVIAI
jgi:hypothetical protein